MTADEYLDRERFPLTTQGNLTLDQQMMIDAVNYDALNDLHQQGQPMSETQTARLQELDRKVAAFPALRR